MYEYVPLSRERFLHKAHQLSDEQFEEIYNARLNDVSTLKTNLYPLLTDKEGYQTNQYPIFLRYTAKMVKRMNFLQRKSKQISRLAHQLPGIAGEQFLSSLFLLEITYTNKIEGVKTNDYELSTIIQQEKNPKSKSSKREPKRLRSTVQLYNQTLKKKFIHIEKLSDFRKIYDTLLAGEIAPDKKPNGKLFRDNLPNHEVLRIGNDNQTVHVPPKSETQIAKALTDLIAFMNNESVPAIIRGLITHFFFENTHPFIDGNGRTGRYLLSTYISRKYDYFTGFSVSTAIHSRQAMYYRIFKEADKLENRGELTFFVEDFLKILLNQQDEVINALLEDQQQLAEMTTVIKQKVKTMDDDTDKKAITSILLLLAQSKLFVSNQYLAIKDYEIIHLNSKDKISFTRTKKALNKLEAVGLIKKVASRPKQHVLADLKKWE